MWIQSISDGSNLVLKETLTPVKPDENNSPQINPHKTNFSDRQMKNEFVFKHGFLDKEQTLMLRPFKDLVKPIC